MRVGGLLHASFRSNLPRRFPQLGLLRIDCPANFVGEKVEEFLALHGRVVLAERGAKDAGFAILVNLNAGVWPLFFAMIQVACVSGSVIG